MVQNKKDQITGEKMDSPVAFLSFEWAGFGTDDYFYAIDKINEIYRKMVIIGKANFFLWHGVSDDDSQDKEKIQGFFKKTSSEILDLYQDIQSHSVQA